MPKTLPWLPLPTGQSSDFLSLALEAFCEQVTSLALSTRVALHTQLLPTTLPKELLFTLHSTVLCLLFDPSPSGWPLSVLEPPLPRLRAFLSWGRLRGSDQFPVEGLAPLRSPEVLVELKEKQFCWKDLPVLHVSCTVQLTFMQHVLCAGRGSNRFCR